MSMFQGDLAFTVELIAIYLGFYFLHLFKIESSKEIKVGTYILIIGGSLTALCNGYFTSKYWMAGSYSHAPTSFMHNPEKMIERKNN